MSDQGTWDGTGVPEPSWSGPDDWTHPHNLVRLLTMESSSNWAISRFSGASGEDYDDGSPTLRLTKLSTPVGSGYFYMDFYGEDAGQSPFRTLHGQATNGETEEFAYSTKSRVSINHTNVGSYFIYNDMRRRLAAGPESHLLDVVAGEWFETYDNRQQTPDDNFAVRPLTLINGSYFHNVTHVGETWDVAHFRIVKRPLIADDPGWSIMDFEWRPNPLDWYEVGMQWTATADATLPDGTEVLDGDVFEVVGPTGADYILIGQAQFVNLREGISSALLGSEAIAIQYPTTPADLAIPRSMKMAVSVFPWNDPAQEEEVRFLEKPTVTWRLRSPSSLAFSLPADFPQADKIEDLETDAYIRIGGELVSRMRCGKTTDNGGPESVTTNFPFIDYRGVLQRRSLRPGMTLEYASMEQASILWGVMQDLQGITNGDYGIVQGVGSSTGVSREWTFSAGDMAGRKFQEIADRAGGFDWDVGPAMELDLYYPERGISKDVVLEYGKNVKAFNSSRDVGTYATDLLTSGGEGTTPVEDSAGALGSADTGVWDAVANFPDVTLQQTLQDHGDWKMTELNKVDRSFYLELVSGFWEGPSQFFIGDSVSLRIKAGRTDFFGVVRITEMTYSQTGDGGETVRIKCGSLLG